MRCLLAIVFGSRTVGLSNMVQEPWSNFDVATGRMFNQKQYPLRGRLTCALLTFENDNWIYLKARFFGYGKRLNGHQK